MITYLFKARNNHIHISSWRNIGNLQNSLKSGLITKTYKGLILQQSDDISIYFDHAPVRPAGLSFIYLLNVYINHIITRCV